MCIIISDTVKAGHGKYPAFSAVMHLKEAAGSRLCRGADSLWVIYKMGWDEL